MIELYYWEPNGCWLKPLIVLHEKGLAFRGRYVDVLALEQHRAGFLHASRETRLNLEGEGPVLLQDGRQVTESLFIAEYIEDAFPALPLRPEEPIGRARILAWARFINEVFMPGVNTLGCRAYLAPQLKRRNLAVLEPLLAQIPMKYLQEGWRRAIEGNYPDELIADSQRKVSLSVRKIEDALSNSQWLVGPTYSLADIDAFSICNSLTELTPALVNPSTTPRLMDWLRRIRTRPAVRAALSLSRTGKPEQAFAPGPEHSRWG
jgi:GSH-dependent disulfide-bond oxidoreductase